ncbi:leucine-rich repeat domain-containing protein [Leptospira santarosai]|uniref:leucine-rich repeat domain-containing protein n=1 Tax=Leptospira santarosai TaxID=28183 RepID=UPI00095A5E4B|nr:leucine-rich repeat domain-containing protein [Leptospira santarosai]MDI7163552.1 leucine-rich repeat domain-containing protein [Leptospira santarosai]OLY61236.1 hypothetical protein BV917_06270 [Leptospira santarosai serovar Guaricura]
MNPHSIVKIISLCFFWIPICSVCKIRGEKGTYKNLEEALRNPDKVFVLKMKGTERKKLVTLSREIVRFQNLKELDLEGNQLKEFPKEIGNLKNLRKLDLSENPLMFFPKEITNLESLEELNISGTELTIIPKEIGNLKNLKLLHLSKNRFSPEERKRIRQLLPNCEIYF